VKGKRLSRGVAVSCLCGSELFTAAGVLLRLFAVVLGKLFPGSFFGEMALLDPWEGHNQGSVLAETYVEVLAVNKKQLNTTALGAEFLKVYTHTGSADCPMARQSTRLFTNNSDVLSLTCSYPYPNPLQTVQRHSYPFPSSSEIKRISAQKKTYVMCLSSCGIPCT
jgi:hypothetical protein